MFFTLKKATTMFFGLLCAITFNTQADDLTQPPTIGGFMDNVFQSFDYDFPHVTTTIVQVVDTVVSTMRQPETTYVKNLKLAYEIGSKFGFPETLQAIMIQESNAGLAPSYDKNLPANKRSYGVMQVQIVAARSVLQRTPELLSQYFPARAYRSIKDSEIVNLLVTNSEANVTIAAHHLKIYFDLTSQKWDNAIAAYNVGIGTVLRKGTQTAQPYVKQVKRRLQQIVKPFNKQYDLD